MGGSGGGRALALFGMGSLQLAYLCADQPRCPTLSPYFAFRVRLGLFAGQAWARKRHPALANRREMQSPNSP